jgi:hypothetical protein
MEADHVRQLRPRQLEIVERPTGKRAALARTSDRNELYVVGGSEAGTGNNRIILGRRFVYFVVTALVVVLGVSGAIAPRAIATEPRAVATDSTFAGLPVGDNLIYSVDVTPPVLGPFGGTVELDALLAPVTGCQLKLVSSQSFPIVYSSASVPCANAFEAHITVGANPTAVDRVVTFDLIASDGNDVESQPFEIVLLNKAKTPYVVQATSRNWSGYTVEGGPFTGAEGTFVVPEGYGSDCNAFTSQWVGIDGASNEDLIQAGVMEDLVDPATGKCSRGHVWVEAWWEVLPAPFVPVAMNVNIGDTVTVKINQTEPGSWAIQILDLTTDKSFILTEPYSGPATSAEWIIEAPCLGVSVAPLLPYGHGAFTGLRVGNSQTADLVESLWMHNPDVVSIPQAVRSLDDLLLEGFSLVFV